MTNQDPLRAWADRRRQAQRDRVRQASDNDQDQAATPDPPAVESLTAGSQPSDYKPPTVNDRMRGWMREATYRRGTNPPPAA
jgi:hypothetical protein